MKVNIYALVAAALILISLFLPWISFSVAIPLSRFMGIMSVAYAPFRVSGSYVVWNTSSNLIVEQEVFHESVKPILYRMGFWSTTQVYLVTSFITSMLCLSAMVLLMHASFATGSWSETGRKIAITSSNLSFLSIFLYVMSNWWFVDDGKSDGLANWMRNGGIAFYLNVGFWLAILGSVAAYASWLHPKFIRIEMKIWTGKIETFKRLLPVSEWQKIAVIATSSFLVIFVFAIIYLFLMPQTF